MDNYNAADLSSVLRTLSDLTAQAQSPPGHSAAREQHHHDQGKPPSHTRTPPTDLATITTWPAALRYVMRTVGQNEETQLRIRGLIQSQHTHERQWWKGRQALLAKQAARGEKKKELDAVLRSIGAPVDPKEVSTVAEDRAALTNYDEKVYKASVQMAETMAAELRGMGIPFFGKGLVVRDEAVNDDKAKLTASELHDLQRRMLELLQDLCKE
ncbi:hypothetical protein N7474_003054 [Penicillium riverlandense]|uniref:uncharacterized protein n=1 Tax=Penicillium riverlandense TaxID=1903569 RepID=UPI002548FA0D|nr:uncharacterized protein N7474_003054 [Penicillium riverlandense]KAJ5825916.1 hypothetical protein N7474_003054 [Penicillium riverlandense]